MRENIHEITHLHFRIANKIYVYFLFLLQKILLQIKTMYSYIYLFIMK